MNEFKKGIFKLLGIEPLEPFKIKRYDFHEIDTPTFRLTEGMEIQVEMCSHDNPWSRSNYCFEEILNGRIKIVNMPWKPTNNEVYYKVEMITEQPLREVWIGSAEDYSLFKCGNCFRTLQEITPEKIRKLKAFYESEQALIDWRWD